jgi:hypothetical protein
MRQERDPGTIPAVDSEENRSNRLLHEGPEKTLKFFMAMSENMTTLLKTIANSPSLLPHLQSPEKIKALETRRDKADRHVLFILEHFFEANTQVSSSTVERSNDDTVTSALSFGKNVISAIGISLRQ